MKIREKKDRKNFVLNKREGGGGIKTEWNQKKKDKHNTGENKFINFSQIAMKCPFLNGYCWKRCTSLCMDLAPQNNNNYNNNKQTNKKPQDGRANKLEPLFLFAYGCRTLSGQTMVGLVVILWILSWGLVVPAIAVCIKFPPE